MRFGTCATLFAALLLIARPCPAGTSTAEPSAAETAEPSAADELSLVTPLRLQVDRVESIYAPREVLGEEQGVNEGAVNFSLTVTVWTDYVFRGIDRSESGGTEDSPNVQFDGALRFDLGRYPDLILGLFTNIYDEDPISRFQEIRPYFALEASVRPFTFAVGNTYYIFPDRDDMNTAEVWARLTIDDSYFFRTDDPVFSPYVFAAWDYDLYDGLYVELGVRHDFVLEGTPLVLSPMAHVAYVNDHAMFIIPPAGVPDRAFAVAEDGDDSGFQHYQVGLEATVNLNGILNVPARYGQLDFKGYLFFTEGIDDDLRADTELYGGIGIGFSY